ncbi:MAG TPA: hypothetical protein VHD32_01315 [Candidatus Didemnitutus sp.]|nr:hypothetical protein [Candidatus Didemnitutus sp.]
MPHQFHDHTRRDARFVEQRAEGVAQCVEIDATAQGIDDRNATRLQILGESLRRWNAEVKYFSVFGSILFAHIAKRVLQQRHERQHGAFSILRRGRANLEVRIRCVEVHVRPGELLDLTSPQPGVDGEQIGHAACAAASDEQVDLMLRQSAPETPFLALGVGFGDMPQGIVTDAAVAFQPGEERRR